MIAALMMLEFGGEQLVRAMALTCTHLNWLAEGQIMGPATRREQVRCELFQRTSAFSRKEKECFRGVVSVRARLKARTEDLCCLVPIISTFFHSCLFFLLIHLLHPSFRPLANTTFPLTFKMVARSVALRSLRVSTKLFSLQHVRKLNQQI